MSSTNTKTFRILYTNQLRKKAPSYKDGFLKYNVDTKSLIILDDKNNKVEQTFVSHCDGLSNVENGEEFTTKSLKIQIEDEISSSATTTSTPSSSNNNNYNNNSNSSFSSSQQTKPSSSSQPRTTPATTTITRTTTTTTTGRKPFKTPFKENFDTNKKNNEEVNNPKPVSRLTPSPMFQQQQATTSFGSNTVRRAPPAVQQQELDDEFLLEDDELDLGDFDVPSTKPAVTSKFFKTDSSTTISQNSRMTSQGLNSTNSSYKSASQVAPKHHQQQANQQQKNSNISTQNNLNNNSRYNPPPQQPKHTPQNYDEEDDETFDFTELEFEKETSGHSSTASFLKSKFENNQNKPTRALYKPPSFEEEEKEVLYNEDEFILEDDEIQPPPQQQRPPVNSNLSNRSVNGGQQSVSKPTPVQSHNQFNKPKIDLLIDDDDFEDGLISLPEETKPNRPTIQPQANVPKKTTPSVNNVNTTNSSFQSASRIVQKPKPTPQLDLSLENLDVDSDEDLKLDSPPKFKKPTFNPPTQVSKPPQKSTPKPSQPNKRQLLMDDDDDDDDTAFATPQAPSSLSSTKSNSSTTTTFTPPQRFVPPSPSSVTSSTSSSTSSQYSTPNSLPSQKFTPTRISPNKKFKQTQLSMGQKESPKATYSQSSNTNEIPILSLVQKLKRTKHEIIFPDMEMNDLYEQNNTHPKRCIEVPNKFTSIDHYKAVFLDAIFEEMNLQMFNLANNFYKTYRKITQTGSMAGAPKNDNAPNCKCGLKAKLKIVKKDGPNKGKPFYGCGKPTMNDTCQFFSWANNVHPSFVTNSRNGFLENKTGDFDRMSFFRRNGIHFYFGCDLVKQTFGSARKKTSVTQWFLQIENKEKSTVYAKDDIWILSKSKDFQFKTGHIVIAKSVFHGPDKDGKVELEIISGLGDNLEQETVFAVRGPNFSTELEMIENLTELDPLKLPLLTEILGTTEEESLELFRKRLKTKFKPPIQKSSTEEDDESKGENEENQDASLDPQAISFELEMDSDEMHNTAKSFIEEYKLNEDQANLIYRCAKWFEKGDISSPICLVHGVFGAGKTTLLIVLILFMCRILDEADNSSVRILIASVTNVAVDNILEGLITENYKNLVRVGSQKKIAKSVLPYTVSSDNISVKDQIKSLQDMLKDKDIDPDEEAGIKQAIKDLKSGVYENRKQSIKDARVVGVTCAATGFEVLKNQKFSILILDESSQCLEPLALLPLTRFGCMKFVAVGDPLQLPPTLTGSRSGENKEDSLEKTIFIRLSNIGCEPHLLRTQYRCHPKISRITNELFYDNKLVDGITEDDREPLIPGMPPVLVVDCENGTETMENNSYKNELETKSIIHFIQLLLQNGIAHEDIGVIALYKTQETYLKTQFITNNLKAVKVSTVDAFQGGEKNIVFVSTSRTSEYGLAFIEQKQRLNVALSRARNHLVIVGKMKTLLKGSYWSKVIGHAQRIKGSVWLSDIILANNDFDFLSKFKHCYHPINKPSKQVLLDDDEEDINDSILSEDILPPKPKEKNKHLEKLSAVTDRRHKHKIEVDEDEMEYDFEEDSKPVNQSNKGTSLAAEDNEYQFSDDEEIDFNAVDEIMKDMEETSSSKRKIDQISPPEPSEEPKVQDNIDYTPKKKKLSTGSEVEIIEDEFDLMPTPEKDTSSTNLEKDSSFNEPIQTLKPTINFSQLNADIKLTQDNTKTDEGKKNTPQEIDFDDLSYLDDL